MYHKLKRCAVPLCGSTSVKTPNKLFVFVPKQKIIRDKWFKLARRDITTTLPSTTLYFCEDHFDMPNDMENYMKYHLMGSVSQVRMKPGCMPTRYHCQPDRRKRTSAATQRPYILKKQRKIWIEESEKDLEKRILATNQLQEHGAASHAQPGPSRESSAADVWQNDSDSSDTDASNPTKLRDLSLEQCRFCSGFTKDCVKVNSEKLYLEHNRTAITLNGLSVNVDFSDTTLPQTVCRDCDGTLQDIFNFINDVKAAQNQLNNIAEEKGEDIETLIIKTESCSPSPEDNDIKEEVDPVYNESEVKHAVFTHKRKTASETNEKDNAKKQKKTKTEFVKHTVFTHKRKTDNVTNEISANKQKKAKVAAKVKGTAETQTKSKDSEEEYESKNYTIIDIKEEIVERNINSEVQMGNYEVSDTGTDVKPSELELAISGLQSYND